MRHRVPTICATFLVGALLAPTLLADDLLHWSKLPALPDAEGFAGMAAGVFDGKLIAAGGANFPAGYPWQGGKKAWYDAIFVLDAPGGQWRRTTETLPHTLAYAVSVTYEDALIIAGGETGPGVGGQRNDDNAPRYRADVLRIRYRDGKIETEDLPPLPQAAAHQCGVLIGSTLYLAGGSPSPDATAALDVFWSLDLSQPRDEMQWTALPSWPGPPRMQAVAGVQGEKFFLFGGLELTQGSDGKPQRIEPYLRDAYCFTPDTTEGATGSASASGSWRRIADLPREAAAAASPALASGAAHLTIIGGTSAADQRLDQPTHPGWSRDALVYHAVTDRWITVADAVPDGASRVTVSATSWNGVYTVVSGERSPGRRSPDVFSVAVQPHKADFGWINYTSLALYLAAMIGVGVYFSRRNKSTDDFFRGGQHIPAWAAGLSIFATMLSSITYMAIPGVAFADGWTLFLNNAYIVLMPLVVFVFLPFYRQLDVTSVYEYLERRFNAAARLGGSLLFMLFQGGRIAVVLYLPSLALSTVTDFNVVTCILIMGVVSIVYTMMGGIEAVIWTDVVQTFVLLGGAALSLVLILVRLDGGVAQIIDTVDAADRFFEPVVWDARIIAASAWVIVVGSIFSNLLPYTAGQDVVQRYMTTKDQASAARAIWTNAAIAVPANATFFIIGSALLAFYAAHPERLDPTMKNDAVFPLFIANELPIGLAGVVMAGVFAAAQSTISSSLNSIAACYVTDFHRRLVPTATDAACLRVARIATALVGVVGTAAALFMALANVKSAFEVFLEILALFGGTLAGLFVLGIFSRRATGRGAVVGAIASMAVVAVVKVIWSPYFFIYAPLGMGVLAVVGYTASLVLPDHQKDLTGLTIHTRRAIAGSSDI